MARKWFAVLVTAALVVALAGVIWAKTNYQGQMTQDKMMRDQAKMQVARAVSLMGEHARCTKTCNTVMPFYTKKFTTLRTHEGDKQCWHTCWNRFGDRTMKSASMTDMKKLWTSKNAQSMRTNQCAQACWRKYHEGQAMITVAGYRSEPRPWVSGGMGGMMAR